LTIASTKIVSMAHGFVIVALGAPFAAAIWDAKSGGIAIFLKALTLDPPVLPVGIVPIAVNNAAPSNRYV
jgi:hypothetical protein